MQRIGFVGLGAMGAPMAKSLASAGFGLSGFDVRPENAQPLVELGAAAATSPREAAEGTEALVLMVVNAVQTEEALFGAEGAAAVLEPGSAVVTMSTVGPGAVRGLEERLAERGLRLLDAPVSGGVARAERGDLLIMAGGPRELFEELRPALEAMGSTVAHCGESVGDGQSVKLVNQLLCGVHIAAAGEALAYAAALGLDPRSVHETIRHGAAASFMLDDRGERMLQRAFTPVKSALDIFVKDMGLVREAAGEQGFATPLADTAHRVVYTGSPDPGDGEIYTINASGGIRPNPPTTTRKTSTPTIRPTARGSPTRASTETGISSRSTRSACAGEVSLKSRRASILPTRPTARK